MKGRTRSLALQLSLLQLLLLITDSAGFLITPTTQLPAPLLTTASRQKSNIVVGKHTRATSQWSLQTTSQSSNDNDNNVKNNSSIIDNVGFVILAGGKGSRMQANQPKQFLPLKNVPILHYSLDLFLQRLPAHLSCLEPPFCVLVIDPIYQPEYQDLIDRFKGRLAFANPGVERQGSVENGLAKLVKISSSTTTSTCDYVAIHDSARPLVTIDEVLNVISDAKDYGAAVLGVPCKATIKESEDGLTVLRTIPRARLWEVHTPQVVKIDLLQKGFAKVTAENLEVTDDVSIVEALGEPVKLTLGKYTNLKITTPEDMDVAAAILEERKAQPVNMLAKAPC